MEKNPVPPGQAKKRTREQWIKEQFAKAKGRKELRALVKKIARRAPHPQAKRPVMSKREKEILRLVRRQQLINDARPNLGRPRLGIASPEDNPNP